MKNMKIMKKKAFKYFMLFMVWFNVVKYFFNNFY